MKLMICGSRTLDNPAYVWTALSHLQKHMPDLDISQIVSGTCYGPDQNGEDWAYERNIPCSYFPADWNRYGKSAGYRRNVTMVEYSDIVIAIWDGVSKGTLHSINLARSKNVPVWVFEFRIQ